MKIKNPEVAAKVAAKVTAEKQQLKDVPIGDLISFYRNPKNLFIVMDQNYGASALGMDILDKVFLFEISYGIVVWNSADSIDFIHHKDAQIEL